MNYLGPDTVDRKDQNTQDKRPETRQVHLDEAWSFPRVLDVIYDERSIGDRTGRRDGDIESDIGGGGNGESDI